MYTPEWLNREAVPSPYLCLCLSEADFRAMAGPLFKEGLADFGAWVNEDASATTHQVRDKDGRAISFVCLRDERHSLSAIVGILAHEARHVYECMTWTNSGMPWGDEELSGVCIGHITQMLFAEYLRQKGVEDAMPRRKRRKKKV